MLEFMLKKEKEIKERLSKYAALNEINQDNKKVKDKYGVVDEGDIVSDQDLTAGNVVD